MRGNNDDDDDDATASSLSTLVADDLAEKQRSSGTAVVVFLQCPPRGGGLINVNETAMVQQRRRRRSVFMFDKTHRGPCGGGIRIFLSICSLLKYNNIELSEGCCPPAHRTPSTMSPFPQLPPNPHRHHPSPPKVVSSVVVDELSTNVHEQRQCQDLLLMQSVLPTFYSTEV
jgi:hypothetical protein